MSLRMREVCTIVALVFAMPVVTLAQSYPAKPIRMLVGVPPGGTTDVLARLVGEQLAKQLGQQIIIENRAGASGNIAGEIVAKAPPDGYTLYLSSIGTFVVNPSLYANMPFDTLRDFAAISQLTSIPQLLVIHPSLPVKDVRELIAYAKGRPGELNFASGSTGSATHLAGEVFNTMANVKLVHIPYKGSGPAMIDLLGGRVSMMFEQIVTALPPVRSGKLRALGVTTLKRSPVAGDIATIAESGLPGYDVTTWHGLVAPAATPRDIVNRLSSETARALQSKELSEKFLAQGADPVSSTPEQFSAFLKSELEKWTKVVKDSGAKLE